VPIVPLCDEMTTRVLSLVVESALEVGGGDETLLAGKIEEMKQFGRWHHRLRGGDSAPRRKMKRNGCSFSFDFMLHCEALQTI
jgi:hypothetical protein